MEIIAVCSQKGGSGKTTTAINLSAALTKSNKKILLLDFDPQSHATMGLGIKNERSIYDVLSNVSKNKCKLNQIIEEVENNFYMVPSSLILSTIEQEFSDEIGRESRLKDVIYDYKELDRDAYDFIIIDCPPNLGLLTINALRVANSVIIPVEASRFSFEGVTQVIDIINLVCERLNHHLSYRVLVSNFDSRLQHSFQILRRIKETFKEKVYSTIVHINVKLKESQAEGKAIFSYDKYSRGAKDFYTLSREIITVQEQEEVSMEEITREFKNVTKKELKEFIKVKFSFSAPTARSVFVVGSFNNWSMGDETRLEKEDGVWSRDIPLKKGTYQYRFVVDGQWLADPINSETTENPLGGFNSVVVVK